MEQLRNYLRSADASIEIAAEIDSVATGKKVLPTLDSVDLVFSDIQLSDGLAFEVLELLPAATPVVFVTAFDDYLLKAFEFHSVDYLLKPLRKEKLAAAVQKYKQAQARLAPNLTALMQTLAKPQDNQRLLVRKGTAIYPVSVADAAYFYSEHKLVHLVDVQGVRYVSDHSLAALEQVLPAGAFYRANRNFLVGAKAVASFRAYGKSKLELTLQPKTAHQVLVSQEKASEFKRWLGAP